MNTDNHDTMTRKQKIVPFSKQGQGKNMK